MWSDDLLFKEKVLAKNKFTSCSYFGQLKSSTKQPHGIGRIQWSNNAIFEGILVKGERTGFGRMIFANGSFFEGFFKDGLFEGDGK